MEDWKHRLHGGVERTAGLTTLSLTPFLPRICPRTLLDCFVLRKGGRSNPSVTSRFLLTCALLMTSSHSEGRWALQNGPKNLRARWNMLVSRIPKSWCLMAVAFLLPTSMPCRTGTRSSATQLLPSGSTTPATGPTHEFFKTRLGNSGRPKTTLPLVKERSDRYHNPTPPPPLATRI